jgi:hypothetical protein
MGHPNLHEVRQRQSNVGSEMELVGCGGAVARRIPKALRFTPVLQCILQHPFTVEEHDEGECYIYLTISNPD